MGPSSVACMKRSPSPRMNSPQHIACFVLARLPDSLDGRRHILNHLVTAFPSLPEPRRLLALLDQHIQAQRELVFTDAEAERGHPRLGDRPLASGSGRLGDKTATRGDGR